MRTKIQYLLSALTLLASLRRAAAKFFLKQPCSALLFSLLALGALVLPAGAQSVYPTPYTFNTLAGLAGSSGTNDGTGSAARFYLPWGVAVDSAGNVYVADRYNSTIRKVTPVGTNWVVTTLAGLAGSQGSADGTGSTARFLEAVGVEVDSAGNVYVADTFNNTIRKVTPVGTNWVVTTLAGLAGSQGGADGTGSAARFYTPYNLAVDSAGNVYVGDGQNYTIRRGSNSCPLVITCSTNKTVQCGTNWTFDLPSGSSCCGSNVTITSTGT